MATYATGNAEGGDGGGKTYADDATGRAKRLSDKAKGAPERGKERIANRKAAATALAGKKKKVFDEFLPTVSDQQWERYEKGWADFDYDEMANKYSVVAIAGKDPSYPVLRATKSPAERAHAGSSMNRLERNQADAFKYLGVPGMGAVLGTVGIASKAKGLSFGKLITPNMGKAIPSKGPLKAIDDIPQGLDDQASAVAQRLFNKSVDDIDSHEAHIVWDAIVNKKKYKPAKGVLEPRQAAKARAEETLARTERKTGRQRDAAGRRHVVEADKQAAKAAGTPEVGAGPQSTPRRPSVDESPAEMPRGPSRASAKAKGAGRDARATREELKEQTTGGAERPRAPSMADDPKLTDWELDAARAKAQGTKRKTASKAAKQAASDLGREVKGIEDVILRPNASPKDIAAAEEMLARHAASEVPEIVAASEKLRGRIVSARGRASNLDAAARARFARRQERAARRKKKVEDRKKKRVEQTDADKLQAAAIEKESSEWQEFLKMDEAARKEFVLEASEQTGMPWSKMNAFERRAAIESATKARAAKAEAMAEAVAAEKAATVGPIGAIERGARQVAFGGPKAVGAGVRGTKKLVGKALRGELPKNVPIGTGVLAAAGGTAYALKGQQLESDEKAMNEAAQAKLAAKGISVPKALSRKKVKDDLKVAAREHDKVGWYKDKVEDWPKNWLTLYDKLHEWGGWQARGKYLDYQQDLNKSPAQGRAFAAKDFPRMVQDLINRKIITPQFLTTSYGDNDIAVDFDLEALGSILNKKAAK